MFELKLYSMSHFSFLCTVNDGFFFVSIQYATPENGYKERKIGYNSHEKSRWDVEIEQRLQKSNKSFERSRLSYVYRSSQFNCRLPQNEKTDFDVLQKDLDIFKEVCERKYQEQKLKHGWSGEEPGSEPQTPSQEVSKI